MQPLGSTLGYLYHSLPFVLQSLLLIQLIETPQSSTVISTSHQAYTRLLPPAHLNMGEGGFEVSAEQICQLVDERNAEHADIRACAKRDADWHEKQAKKSGADLDVGKSHKLAGRAHGVRFVRANRRNAGVAASAGRPSSAVSRYDLPKIQSNLSSTIPMFMKHIPVVYPGALPVMAQSTNAAMSSTV